MNRTEFLAERRRSLAGLSVLVVGASGFIGSALAERLAAADAVVVGMSRSRPRIRTPMHHIRFDIAEAREPRDWFKCLQGIDAVVYCAGTLQSGGGESTRAVHETGPQQLFQACVELGIARVVHLSALGADHAVSDFSATKRAGDRSLMRTSLDWVILRPSLVIGADAMGSAALLRGLATLPVLPLPPRGAPLQVVPLDDVIDTILYFIAPDSPARVVVDLVGPREWPLEALVAALRGWMGRPAARTVNLPRWLWRLLLLCGDAMAALGWRSALRSNAGLELVRAPLGSSRQWRELTGIQPADLMRTLMTRQASIQERWFARLYLLRLPLFAVCALFWIATGLVALGPGRENHIELLREAGVRDWPAVAVAIGVAVADIAIGLAIIRRRTARAGMIAALLVLVTCAAVGTAVVPRLWVDPLGPLLKVLPILALHLAALGLIEDR